MRHHGTYTDARNWPTAAALSVLLLWAGSTHAQTTSFSYQGRLSDGGMPASGVYEMEFKLYDALTEGTPQPQPAAVTIDLTAAGGNAVLVTNGVFTVRLDFGVAAFPDSARYLEIGVRHPGETSFISLTPRQQVTATPYAIRSAAAAKADNATELKTQLSEPGTLNNPANPVDWTELKNVPATVTANYGAGPGISISGTTVSNTGVLSVAAIGPLTSSGGPNPQLSLSGVVPVSNGGTGSGTKNFVDLSTNQIVSGTKTFGNMTVTGAITLSGKARLTLYDPALVATLRWDLLPLGFGDFAVGNSPGAVAFDGANIWVVNGLDNSVTKLRATDGTKLGSFPVGATPTGLAFDGTNIWVTNSAANTVTKLRAIDGSNLGTFAAGITPSKVAWDGTNIWVISKDQNREVTKLRASDGVKVGTIHAAGALAIAFDGTNMWVAGFDSPATHVGFVTKLPPQGSSTDYEVDRAASDLVFDGANIWVLMPTSSSVTKLRASDGTKIATFSLASTPGGLAFDGANIWVTNALLNTVTKLRASDGANLGTVVVGKNPVGVAFDGTSVWVANSRSNTVSKR